MAGTKSPLAFKTRLLHAGRDPSAYHGAVNTPPFPVSTILSKDLDAYLAVDRYGRLGTETSRAAEQAAALIECAEEAVSFPSGLAAITGTLLSVVGAGDGLLVAENVYGPTRHFCDVTLRRLGAHVTFFDPMDVEKIGCLIDGSTKAIFLESPGSHSFEVCDVPAIAAVARDRGILSILDNTWSAGVFFKPLTHGVDISVQSGTKYWSGHSDLMLGFAIGNAPVIGRVRNTSVSLGLCASPDVCFLALRGMRTLPLRLQEHHENGIALAQWLAGHPKVERVMHPALASCDGHEIWKRDFSGAAGVFSFALRPEFRDHAAAFVNTLRLFPIGDSWGGYESLIVPSDRALDQRACLRPAQGPVFRLHAGLEAVEDLIADLCQALESCDPKKN